VAPVADKIPVFWPRLPSADRILPYLRQIDATRLYSNWGPLADELEARLKLRLGGTARFVCAGSGTAALQGAILARVGRASAKKDLALAPSFTFIATAFAAESCGYSVDFADVDPMSWMLTPEIARRCDLDRVGVVIPVAPFGRPVAQTPWLQFEAETGIPVVIDAAASLDTVARDPARFLGRVPAAFSFHATKSFGAGEGGAVACTDEDLAEKIVRALNFGVCRDRDAEAPGFNGKMSEYHAAVGLAELADWDEKLAAYDNVVERYRARLGAAGLAADFVLPPDISACYALLQCAHAANAERAIARFDQAGVGWRRWYGFGLHRHTYYAGRPRRRFPVTEDLAARLIGAPTAPDLTTGAIDRVARAAASALLAAPKQRLASL
jgi:dTDP-4-amino-4,6-dideoxygalactose transaminase